MPALGERGSATRARCLLCGGGRAGVTGTLLAEPISTGRKGVGQGLGPGEEGMPKRSDSGLSFTATTSDLELQTTRSSQIPAKEAPGRRARGLWEEND